jgi:hypothetical protein
MSEARTITAGRWGELGFLREIPPDERPRWVFAPLEMTFAEASRWARQIRADKIIQISTGETMVRLAEKAPSPWGLPS